MDTWMEYAEGNVAVISYCCGMTINTATAPVWIVCYVHLSGSEAVKSQGRGDTCGVTASILSSLGGRDGASPRVLEVR